MKPIFIIKNAEEKFIQMYFITDAMKAETLHKTKKMQVIYTIIYWRI